MSHRNPIITFVTVLFCLTGLSNSTTSNNNNKLDSLLEVIHQNRNDSAHLRKLIDYASSISIDDLQLSLHLSQYCLDAAKDKHFTPLIAKSAGILGTNYSDLGQYDLSLEYLTQAYEIYDQMDDTLRLTAIINNIGNIYFFQNELEHALTFYNEAFHMAHAVKNTEVIASATMNIGLIYQNLKKSDSAIYYFQKARELAFEMRNSFGIAVTSLNMASFHSQNNNYKKAAYILTETYDRYSNEMGAVLRANFLNLLSVNYLKSKEYPKLQVTFRQTEALFAEHQLPREEADYYHARFQFDSIFGKHQSALNHYIKYSQLVDSVNKQKSIADLRRYKLQYDIEKKNREIESLTLKTGQQDTKLQFQKTVIFISSAFCLVCIILFIIIYRILKQRTRLNDELLELNFRLSKKNTQLSDSQNQLKTLNDTKDKLFGILAHDLKDPFNALMGISGMLADKYDQFSDEKRKLFAHSVSQTSKEVYYFLENLLFWSRSQTGSLRVHYDKINLHQIADAQINVLSATALRKNLRLMNHIPDNIFIIGDTQMVSAIIRNLVSNAIKFTKETGIIEIYAHKQDTSQVLCEVKDNGIGISPTEAEKLFSSQSYLSRPGTKGERGTGLGLTICSDFINMLNGKIGVKSQPNMGSTFWFTLPMS